MTTADITRHLFQPLKHYVGARSQQGRVLLDSDVNEAAQAIGEEQRAVLLDVIGPNGSPDDGFLPDVGIGDEVPVRAVSFNGGAAVDCLDLRLATGTLYVAGLRFEHHAGPATVPAGGDRLVFQRDFLGMTADLAPRPDPGNVHGLLTVLHGWEQDVLAVEDEEIREVALGGLDTSTRVRRMARVETRAASVDADCAAAWATARAAIEAEGGGTFDAAGVELRSSARLRIAFVEGEAEDACSPCGSAGAGRYLGADNQTIRIMLAAPGRYVFGADNASRLYRVRLGRAAGGRVPVAMLTPPRGEARWPLANTVMELLGAGTILDNGSTVAAPVGVFVRVVTGYDPATGAFEIDASDLPALAAIVREWDAAHPESARLPDAADLFARPWHRVDTAADPILLDTAGTSTHALLRRLGVFPEFHGTGQAGDYWSVTLRPNTPQQVVPWNLAEAGGVAPHGPRRFFAPIAKVVLRPPGPGEHANTEVVQSVEDCRRRFRPLVERAGCCTHTVGDGVVSRGDYGSINAAIAGLPPEGGTVCILPGRFHEEVTVARDDVVVEGCRGETEILTPGGAAVGSALVRVTGRRITLRDLRLSARGQVGVLVGAEAAGQPLAAEDVVLSHLAATGAPPAAPGGQTRTVIDVRRARRVTIEDCDLAMTGALSDEACVFLRGEAIRLARSRVDTAPDGATNGPWGGVQIGGGSRSVTLERNRIAGGIGHGVTLGSVDWVAETTGEVLVFGAGAGQLNPFDPCAPRIPVTQAIEIENVRYDPRTGGDLADIVLRDNRIERMSGNGISVLTTLPLRDGEGEDLITVDRILIERNVVAGNVVQSSALPIAALATKPSKGNEGQEDVFGQFRVSSVPPGGIVLLDGEGVVIRDNEIRDNGTEDVNPVSGISITYGNAVVIEGNRIANNGLRSPGSTGISSSARAGIVVSLAGIASNRATVTVSDPEGSSLRVANNIVQHPNGPALAARATGPMAVTGNILESLGNNASAQPVGVAHCVALTNVGLPFTALDLPPGEPSADRWTFPPRTPEYLAKTPSGGTVGGVGAPGDGGPRVGFGGQILFSGNQVMLHWAEAGAGTISGLQSGFSVGLSSLDNVVMTGNQLALNVADPGVKKTSAGTLSQRPKVSAHAVVVGATATVSDNRVAEGVNDALISLLVLGGLLVSATGNVTTHLSRVATVNTFRPNTSEPPLETRPLERVDRGNLVWLRPAAETSAASLVSVATVNSTANALFAALAESALGLPTGGNTFGGLQAFAVVFTGLNL
jgi:hypothetical protein